MRGSTSVAVGVIQVGGVVSGAVGRDSVDPRLLRCTLGPQLRHRVADAAIRQPSRGAAVQAALPGQVELPHRGQLPSEGHAAVRGRGQGQAAGDGGVKHLSCRTQAE